MNPCLKCHTEFKEFKKPAKNDHAATVKDCGRCHMEINGREHPEQKNSITLTQDVPQLCYSCHNKSHFTGEYIHSPVAGGMCASCHKIHKSDSKNFLNNKPPELCFACHDKGKFTKKYIHPVSIGRSCDCHNPHASHNPYLLSTSINQCCVGCHKAQETGRHITSLPGRKIHPIRGIPDIRNLKRKLSCASCHDPHSSNFPKLFLSKVICQRCHKYY